MRRFIRSFSDSPPTLTPAPKSTSTWDAHWNEAIRLHVTGQLYSALVEYGKALELMPTDDSLMAFRAGMNIARGEVNLLLFNGMEAHMCSQEAKQLLDQATAYEKQGIDWNLMANQALIIDTASLIYIPDNKGNYAYGKARELLQKLTEWNKMPEVNYFLGVVNDKMGNKEEAKRQFETFLSAPDILVTFTSKDIMRQRARDWLTQARE
jgi:tetratricopeptide (TPR) repeat protein